MGKIDSESCHAPRDDLRNIQRCQRVDLVDKFPRSGDSTVVRCTEQTNLIPGGTNLQFTGLNLLIMSCCHIPQDTLKDLVRAVLTAQRD